MKVGYFVNAYPKISHTFIRREIEALESLGIEVKRYSLRPNSEELIDARDKAEVDRTKYLLTAGFGVFAQQVLKQLFTNPVRLARTIWLATKIGVLSERGLLRHYAYVLEAAVLAGWCTDAGLKHLHAHFGTNSATVAMFVSELAKITFSFTAHGADELDSARSKDMRAKLAKASFIVGVSFFVRSQLLRQLPYEQWDKIKVLRCGLGADYLDAAIPGYPESKTFVCVGRLCDEKAQVLLIESARRLRTLGHHFHIILAGDGPRRSQIEAMISEFDLNEYMTITGWVNTEQVMHQLASARFFVLPSLIEGLPVAIMEAMALGRPTLSTFVAGIPELVVTGENGWLIPAGDADALTRAMAKAIDTPTDTLQQMGSAAKAKVIENHDVKTEASKLAALFRRYIP